MCIAIAACVTLIWILIRVAQAGYPQPLEIMGAGVGLEILWRVIIRPLGSLLFSGKAEGVMVTSIALQPDGKPPLEWDAPKSAAEAERHEEID